MEILLAREMGFCFGVERAISLVYQAREEDPEGEICVLHEIVHNKHVIRELEQKSIRCVEALDEIPSGRMVVSAHGVSPEVVRTARARGLHVLDATCPLVTRIHRIVRQLAEQGKHVILLGDEGHSEVTGIVGQAPDQVLVIHSPDQVDTLPAEWEDVALLSQTTQDRAQFATMVDRLKTRFPQLQVFDTICDATARRQRAIRELARCCQVIFVVGSTSSANANRLCDIARDCGADARLIENADALREEELQGLATVGVSAGASTPEVLISHVVDRLIGFGGVVREIPIQIETSEDEHGTGH